MQKQNLLKERNGASLKPETQTPSSTLDTAVVVIDEMTSVCPHYRLSTHASEFAKSSCLAAFRIAMTAGCCNLRSAEMA